MPPDGNQAPRAAWLEPSPRVSSAAGVEPEVGAEKRPAQRLGLEVHQAVPGAGENLVHHREHGSEEAARQDLGGTALAPLLGARRKSDGLNNTRVLSVRFSVALVRSAGSHLGSCRVGGVCGALKPGHRCMGNKSRGTKLLYVGARCPIPSVEKATRNPD